MKRTTRIFGLCLTLFALALLGACGGTDVEETKKPTKPRMSDAEALIGNWSSGSNMLSIKTGGQYAWDRAHPCGNEPCPTKKVTGSWELRRGRLYFDPTDGEDQVLDFKISWEPRKLWLKVVSGGAPGEWNLIYRE